VSFQKPTKNEIRYLARTSAKIQNDNAINSSSRCHKLIIQIALVVAVSNVIYIPQELSGRTYN